MFLRLPILMLGTARVEGRSPPSTYTHHPPAQRDAVVDRRRSPRVDPTGAELPGDGVPEHQDTAAFGSGQDGWEVAASGAAAHKQDNTRSLPEELAVGAFASPGRHTSRQHRGAVQANEVGDVGGHRGHRLWEVLKLNVYSKV